VNTGRDPASAYRDVVLGMTLVIGDISPILFMEDSVNHKFPSGPIAIPAGPAFAMGILYSVIISVDGDMLPILFV